MYRVTRWAVMFGCLCACLGACAFGPRAQLPLAEIEGARAALLAADRAWAQAAVSGDIERILTFCADGAVIGLQGGPPPVVGIAAIRQFFTRARQRDPGFSIVWQPAQAWVSANGKIGSTFGIVTRTLTARSGAVLTEKAPYTCVWRNTDGEWKCVIDLRDPQFE